MQSKKRRGNDRKVPKTNKRQRLTPQQRIEKPQASDSEDIDNNEGSQDAEMPLFDFTSPKRLFQSLIHPMDCKQFFDSYWEDRPLVLHRSTSMEQMTKLKELFSKQTLLQLVKNNDMHFMRDLNALRYKDGKRQDLNDEGRITAAKLTKLFDRDKATVQVHQPQRFQDGLWHIMEYLESFFGVLVGANVYITPGDSQGLSPHHDDVEVFILQLEGEKHWRLYKPLEELPRSYSIDLTEDDIGEPTHDLILKPGDLLYFPRGVIHQADTPSGVSHSTHITFSTYQHHCWGDYMMSVFPHILEQAMKSEVAFRRGLPINFIKSTKLSQTDKVQSVLGLLLQKLVTVQLPKFVPPETMIEDFMRSRLPPYLVEGHSLRETLPQGKPPDLGCKVRLKHPDHVCCLVRKTPPAPMEDSEDEEEDEEEDDEDSMDLNQSGASSARFLSSSLMPAVQDDESLFVYSSLFNERKSHMMDAGDDSAGFALRFPKHYLESVTLLKGSCDQFTAVAQLPLSSDGEKENLIRALWSSHLLEVIPAASKSRSKSRKSTKLD